MVDNNRRNANGQYAYYSFQVSIFIYGESGITEQEFYLFLVLAVAGQGQPV